MTLTALILMAAPLAVDLTFILRFEWSIYLVTAVCCLLFAVVIFLLLGRSSILRDRRWAQPFAITFLVLSAIYVLLIIQLSLYGHGSQHLRDAGNLAITIIITCFSGVTNYLFFLSGSRLWEPALTDVQRPLPLGRLGLAPDKVRWVTVGLVLLTVGLAVFGVLSTDHYWATLPDGLLSTAALVFMGFALYKNSNLRREKLVAWVALLSALGYAVIYILSLAGSVPAFAGGLHHFIDQGLPANFYEQLPLAERERFIQLLQQPDQGNLLRAERVPYISAVPGVLVSLVSLPLKFLLFLSATSLMLLLFGPLEQIRKLHERVSYEQGEYLESEGFVKAVWEALPGRKVELFIKVPGSTEDEADGSKMYQVDLIDYPSSSNGDGPEAQRLEYDEQTLYARVMKQGMTVTDKEAKWQGWGGKFVQKPTNIGVPIVFHSSVIACLALEIGDRDFTGTDRSRLERLAVYIAPAVQYYRELATLNRITEKAAEHQLTLDKYDMDEDLGKITEIIHDVVSPLSTGITIRAGFDEYRSIYPPAGHLHSQTEKRLKTPPGMEVASDLRNEHRWINNRKGLTISKVDTTGQKIGEQVFGRFVFAADKESQRREQPTLGTNTTSLYAVSNLLTDILLDFVRGHLNQLTDRLGARLSNLDVTTVADWFKEVERTAQEARLLWAVVRYPGGVSKLLGGEDEDAVKLVEELECPSRAGKWVAKEDGFYLYSLGEPRGQTCHVVRRRLDDSSKISRDSSATLWLGVKHQDFGEELDYVSPWKYFLTHFWYIADSALHRLLTSEERKKRMGEVQSIVAGTLTVGPITHDLITDARALVSIAEALERNKGDAARRVSLLSDMRTKRGQIEGLLPKLSDIYKRDPRQTCQLHEAVERALDRVRYYLAKHQIRVENNLKPGAHIKIPFDAAANALVIVIDNGKDAIVQRLGEGRGESGLIRIGMRETEENFICDIIDNGSGVPPELWDKLFREVSKSKKRNSHGVGLLFSDYLLRSYNGHIEPTEWGPTPNTTFSIYFPK